MDKDELMIKVWEFAGVAVYNSSGPSAAVVRLVADLIADQHSMPSAVIMMTSPEVTSAVSAILQAVGVFHVDISRDDVDNDVSLKGKRVIPLYGSERVEALVTLLDVLNITYVTPTTMLSESGTSVAQRELTYFRRLANQRPQLCAIDSLALLPRSPVPIVFTGDRNQSYHLWSGDSDGGGGGGHGDGGGVVVVVGEEVEGVWRSRSHPQGRLLWLREVVDEAEVKGMVAWNWTLEGFADKLPKWNASLCTSFHINTINNISNINNNINNVTSNAKDEEEDASSTGTSCQLTPHTVKVLQALSDAFAYVTADLVKGTNRTWLESSRNESAEGGGGGGGGGGGEDHPPLDDFLRDTSGDVKKRRRSFEVVVLEKGQTIHDNNFKVFDSLTLPRYLLQQNFSNHCDVNCHLCDVCAPEMTSAQKVMLSSPIKDTSLVIVGLFPISRVKENSGDCSVENSEGLEAAQRFLTILETYQERHGESFPNVSLGGVVLDTCGSKDRASSIRKDIETCSTSYTDFSGRQVVVQPSVVAAYVDFKNYGEFWDMPQTVVKITDEEYSLTAESYVTYLRFMAEILKTIHWTYLKVVINNKDILRTKFHHVLQSSSLCVAEEVLVHENNANLLASRLMNGTSAVLFLTDHPTTLSILQTIHAQNSSAGINYVFMPWNCDVVVSIPHSYSISTAIITQAVIPDSFDFPAVREYPNPWEGTLEKVFTNQSSLSLKGLSLVPLAVDGVVRTLEEVYRTLCPRGQGLCRALQDLSTLHQHHQLTARGSGTQDKEVVGAQLGWDVFAVRGRSRVKIGEVDQQSRVHMNSVSIQDVPSSECPGWCPRCLQCQTSSLSDDSLHPDLASTSSHSRKRSPSSSLYFDRPRSVLAPHHPFIIIPGDVFVAGIFPVHQAGWESFTCGNFVDSSEERYGEQAFLFAVDTARKRYSSLLPGVQIGGILLDSCSNLATALHHLGQFESCDPTLHIEHGGEGNGSAFFSPAQVVGYVLQDEFHTAAVLRDTVKGLKKMATITSFQWMKKGRSSPASPESVTVEAMFGLFSKFSWVHAYILTSADAKYMNMAEYLVDEAGYRGVCVVRYLQLIPGASNVRRVVETLSDSQSTFVPVILFLSRADAVALFRDREVGVVTRPWVISMMGDDWLSTVGINIPWGALLLDVQGKFNDDFQVFLEQFSTSTHTPLSPWWSKYLQTRLGCRTSHTVDSPGDLCDENPLLTGPMFPSAAASRVIKGVDSLLHAVDTRYKSRCLLTAGICGNLSRDIVGGGLSLSGSSFTYEEGVVSFDGQGDMEVTLSVFSYQPGQLVMAGTYGPSGLSINTSLVQFFNPRGQHLPQPHPHSHCPACTCINVLANTTQSPAPSTVVPPVVLADWLWREERGVFIREVWSWSVLAVMVVGCVTALCFISYVMFKVWQGALARRYIGLGLLLLLALALLYLSSLPFLFTPSPVVCGLRYVAPCVALCLCLACVLVKLMALKDYRTIGLGGELSGINQGLSVFFIVLVQISISAQWWIFKGPFLQEKEEEEEDIYQESPPPPHHAHHLPKVSCRSSPTHLVLNLSFVFFLLLLCSIYSLNVRREKKNMGEARLLLVGSWVLVVLWMVWIPALLLVHPRHISLVTSSGILASASALLGVVFVPKVRMVAGLKYDLSKKHAVRNGYSVDTDFLYERPYSLPGTLTSTYSSIRTYPKSVTANFDSSLSY
ncbi:hypothetical protein ACOMHN_065926 [Nucella lapillus]